MSQPQKGIASSDSGTRQLLHLFALNAFALAQPIMDRLRSNPEYLILEDYSASAVLITLAIVMIAPPVGLWLIVRGLRWIGRTGTSNVIMSASMGLYGILTMLILMRWVCSSMRLLEQGIPETVVAVVAAVTGVFLPWLRNRSELFRQGLSLLSIGLFLFPAGLLMSAPIRQHVLKLESPHEKQRATIKNPVPVVMIILDGLSGMSLLDRQHEIDRDRYPSFARLATISHFYRNATTVHTRTDHAVPALLASTIPEEWRSAVEADYPQNLFRMIFDSQQYDMSVFEPVTRLCPAELRQIEHQWSLTRQIRTLLITTLTVYVQGSLPQEISGGFPVIPREWFGLIPRAIGGRRSMKGQIVYAWDEYRQAQFEHFLECLALGERPGFRFLHIALPHYPWSILPSGQSCLQYPKISQPTYGLLQETWSTDPWPVQQAWQRNLLQLQYADRCLGKVLDRLESTGQLRQTMVIVTADHGMSFVPGASLREPTDETLPDILPIPLFVKLPGQTEGSISDRNVETIDILPTIAEVLQMDAAPEWQGASLLSGEERPRKTVRGSLNTVLEPDFQARFRHTERLTEVFGTGAVDDRLGKLNYRPDLVGRLVSEFTVDPSEWVTQATRRQVQAIVKVQPGDLGTDYVPALIHGKLEGRSPPAAPVSLAIAVNGRICVTTRTSTDANVGLAWSVLIPPEALPAVATPLEIYEISDRDEDVLRRIAIPAEGELELRNILEGWSEPLLPMKMP